MEKLINKKLKELGTNSRNEPLFRVSWTDYQTEVRKRTYNKFQGKIFIGLRTEIAECKKYSTIKERWVLEKWCPPDSSYTDEIVSARYIGSYECIYLFQDKEGNYLPLEMRVALIIAKENLNPGEIGKLTDDSEMAQQKEQMKEESLIANGVMEFYEKLMQKDMKYPDGTAANKSGDFFINDATQKL